jgi:hypothetical protein
MSPDPISLAIALVLVVIGGLVVALGHRIVHDALLIGLAVGLGDRRRVGRTRLTTPGHLPPAQPCSLGSYWLPIRRAASAVITRESPRKSMLTPTRRPIAQLAELGQPCQIR